MSFLDRIKQQLSDPRRARGRMEIPVCRQSLSELIHHFEQLDSATRARGYYDEDQLELQLRCTIDALFKQNKGADEIMLCIMDTLGPLIKEKIKENEYNRRLHHHDSSKIKNDPGFLGRIKNPNKWG